MLTNSELKARLARLAPVRDISPAPSSGAAPVELILRREGVLVRAVDVARRLVGAGLTLSAAHRALNELAASGWAVVAVDGAADLAGLGADLAALGVSLHRPCAPGDVDIAAVRERHSLSQRAFADLLGFDLRTLQNWEQGRNRPERAALSLIAAFDRSPNACLALLADPVSPSR